MIRLLNLLNEISIDTLKQNYVDSGKIRKSDFEQILDITNKKSAYATWLIVKIIKGIVKPNDLDKFDGVFSIFDTYKRKFAKNDINQYKTASDISVFLKQINDIKQEVKSDPSKMKGTRDKQVKYKDLLVGKLENYHVYKIEQNSNRGDNDLYNASCELGSATKWCTASGKSRESFDQYIRNGDLIIFLPKLQNASNSFRIQVHITDNGIGEVQDGDQRELSLGDLVDKQDILPWLAENDYFTEADYFDEYGVVDSDIDGFKIFNVGDDYFFINSKTNKSIVWDSHVNLFDVGTRSFSFDGLSSDYTGVIKWFLKKLEQNYKEETPLHYMYSLDGYDTHARFDYVFVPKTTFTDSSGFIRLSILHDGKTLLFQDSDNNIVKPSYIIQSGILEYMLLNDIYDSRHSSGFSKNYDVYVLSRMFGSSYKSGDIVAFVAKDPQSSGDYKFITTKMDGTVIKTSSTSPRTIPDSIADEISSFLEMI